MFPFRAQWPTRLRKVFDRRAVEREIDDEMRQHIELETADLVARGFSQKEARRQAMMAFGGVARYTEEAKDAWPLRSLTYVLGDLTYAARSLRRAPSFTVAAVLALGVAMGGNAFVFSLADSIAFRPLPAQRPHELVAVYGTQGEASLLGFSYPTYEDIRRDASAFADLAAFTEGPVGVSIGSDPEALWAVHTTSNYFSLLGVTPKLGTFFRADDRDAPVVVLSHATWKNRFAADPSIEGKTISVNGSKFTVVGVAPAQFSGTRLLTYDPALWIPIGMHAQTIPGSSGLLTNRRGARLSLIGRTKPGITRHQARESADAVMQRLAVVHPELYRGFSTTIVSNRTPINPWLASPDRVALLARLMVLGASLVLLVACVNVASLLLARMTVRQHEMAVRLSLGASRRRLVQQLLTESVLLAALGALVAVPIRLVVMLGVERMGPNLDYTSTFRPPADTRMWLYSIAVTAGAAILFGLGPALQAARRSVMAGLRGATAGRVMWPRVREWLVVGQVAVSVMVLATAGVLVRGVNAARIIDPGFPLDGAVVFTLDPRLSPAYDVERTQRLYERLNETLKAKSGIVRVGRAVSIPLDGNSMSRRVFTEGGPFDLQTAPTAEYGLSAPGFFAALGTPIIQGREFTRYDTALAVEPVVINDVLARRLFPGEPALGRQIRLESVAGPLEVIGIVRAGKYRTVGEAPRNAVWRNLDRAPSLHATTVVRTTMSDVATMAAIRDAVREIDPTLPILGLATLRERVSLSYLTVESGAMGAAGFGALALILVASGIYGIIAYTISQRRREIGIRVALGARGTTVLRLVTGRVLMVVGVGTTIGLLAAIFAPLGLDQMLFGVSRFDIHAMGAAVVLFAMVALVAAAIPAWRVLRASPVQALRLD